MTPTKSIFLARATAWVIGGWAVCGGFVFEASAEEASEDVVKPVERKLKPEERKCWGARGEGAGKHRGPEGGARGPRGEARGPRGTGKGHPMKKFDVDKDGFLSFEEFSKSPRLVRMKESKRRKLFDYLDQNKDGKLSMRELPRGQHHGPPEINFKKFDEDQSGGLSFEEFSKIPWVARIPEGRRKALFQKMDLKNDGEISPKEVRQAWVVRRRCSSAHRRGSVKGGKCQESHRTPQGNHSEKGRGRHMGQPLSDEEM